MVDRECKLNLQNVGSSVVKLPYMPLQKKNSRVHCEGLYFGESHMFEEFMCLTNVFSMFSQPYQ